MRKTLQFVILFLLIGSCVDRIDFAIPSPPLGDLVVDGVITTDPGPYTVKISRAAKLGDTKPLGIPVSVEKITIFDDTGIAEELKQKEAGTYQTAPNGIRGVVGHTYHIRIETFDNKIFESVPDKLNPVGSIDTVYYEFESRQPESAPTEYGYRIYIDAHSGTVNEENFFRWSFSGTYVVETSPQYYICEIPPGAGICAPPYCPLDCSSYTYVDGVLHAGVTTNCTCCRCWITEPERSPMVSDDKLESNGKYTKVEVGYVPVDFYRFFEKYRVQVTQMSLSRDAMQYWRGVQAQKDALGNLFLPITGKIPSNLFEVNGSTTVQGVFYASAVTKKSLYLDKFTSKVVIKVPVDCSGRQGAMGKSCLKAFPDSFATTVKPADWQ